MSVTTSFPDSSYSTANKPSVETLKTDISALETAQNAHETLTEVHGSSGAVVGLSTLQTYVPVGVMFDYAGATAPGGFLLCDGTAVSRSTYSALFAIIGTTYGAGDSATTFNLPDTRGRVTVSKSTDTEFDTLGETGGVKTVTLTGAQSGTSVHTHLQDAHRHAPASTGTFMINNGASAEGSGIMAAPSSLDAYTAYATATNQNSSAANASEAHTNLQPYITVQKIIKY